MLLALAVRAPSTHNSQPWLFHIDGKEISIFRDNSRLLPEADKDGRDILISIGACLEHLLIAARYYGMLESVTIGDLDDNKAPVAIVALHESTNTDQSLAPLVAAIEKRFNARGPFLQKEISEKILATLSENDNSMASSFFLTQKQDVAKFAELTARGMRHVHQIKNFRAEIARWMHNNYSSKKIGIPGYSMLAPGVISLFLPWLIKTFNCGKILAFLNTKSITSAPLVVVLATPKDDRAAWLATGQRFTQIALRATAEGLRPSIFVASIEIPELRTELQTHLKTTLFPQFTFAVGFPKIMLSQTPREMPQERTYL